MLVMVVIGGKTTIIGPVVGAIIFTFVPEYLRVVNEFRLVLVGAVLLLAVVAFPDGLAALWRRRAARPAT
jgi:branched-chain amino acid transport system permease protein